MELKDKLVNLRKKKGVSQAELAEAIKVSRQAISRWEVGTAVPSADNLMWLSKYYEVSMDELMGVSTNDIQVRNEDQQNVSKRSALPEIILIVLCVIVVLTVVVWIIPSFNKGQKNNETTPVSIGELDSYDVGSLECEVGEFGKENKDG